MANFARLAVGVRHVLAATGWDLDVEGLFGAPEITVVVSEERHATVDRALRLVGFGKRHITAVAADDQGRMRPAALRDALGDRPAIVCAQAGNVNTGAFDPLREICGIAHEHDAWVHVDGAFGLWAAAAPSLRHLVDGLDLADSWATDAHKWLNVPYDCGIVLGAHPDSHQAVMTLSAAYLTSTSNRNGTDWTPESPRRARALCDEPGRHSVRMMIGSRCGHHVGGPP